MSGFFDVVAVIWWAGVLVGTASAGGLCAMLSSNLAHPSLGIWPASGPIRKATALWLFRTLCATIVIVALADLAFGPAGPWWRYGIGGLITVLAYALTLRGYKLLGLSNTYFGTDGLVTTGLYAYSRNPQYVFSVLSALGLALAAGSWATLILTGGLFAVYFLFALNEERWLIKGYGREFIDYMRRVPRFLGERSLIQARQDLMGQTGRG